VGGTHIYVSGGSISGDVVIHDMPVVPAAGYALLLSNGHIGGNVTLQHDAFYLGVYGNYIGGDLLVTGNTGGYSDARLGDVEILRNTVLGNVFVIQNAASGSLIDVFYVSGNTVTQSIEVGNNTAVGGRQLDYVTVNFNTVGGDILVHDNTVVGGEPKTQAFVYVGDNVVASTLDCYSNTPQPVGVPNVAALKLGQCASL
jgi:hypothetical protein